MRGGDQPENKAMGLGLRVALARKLPQFANDRERVSYAIGVVFGMGLRADNYDLDMAVVAGALKDAFADTNSTRLTSPQARAIVEAYKANTLDREIALQKQEEEKNRKAGDVFMAKNATKPGVKVLASGLQYEVLRQGTGDNPATNDTVTIHCRATTIDGKEFTNTYEEGEPKQISLDIHYVIRGLREALSLMKVGDKWRIYVPSDLGFVTGRPEATEPGAALIYEVELLSKRPTREIIEEYRRGQLISNKRQGAQFLAGRAKEDGIQTLPDGLQYRILATGSGPKPGAEDTVDVRWNVKLFNGGEVISDQSVSLDLKEIRLTLKGIFEALCRMEVGSKWELAIPPELAYGDAGHPPDVPPGSVLVCELELLGIKSRPAAQQGQESR
jgi:FKBP-type peptidyl-prolyl cis-trans isomerase